MKVKVDSLMCEGGELIAEAELVRAIFRSSKRETVILLLHFFVQNCTVRILETTVNIIVAPGDNLNRIKSKCAQTVYNILMTFLDS